MVVEGSMTITIKKEEDGDNNDGDDERGQIIQSWELNCLRERERERERERDYVKALVETLQVIDALMVLER